MLGKLLTTIFVSVWCLLSAGCLWQPVAVNGTAMKPNLNNGDRIFVDRNFGELKRGDVVAFYFPKDQTKIFVKRIIGLPGESLEIRAGAIFINGQELTEPYVDPANNFNKIDLKPVSIPPDHYFVAGDNRVNSYDSRSWGTVPKDLIYGKYSVTYIRAG